MVMPTPPRRLRARLAGWYAVCAGLLLGHAAWFAAMRLVPVADRSRVIIIGGAALAALIVLLALLLATTPADAIRLPRRRSEALIVGGAIFLQLTAIVIASPLPAGRIVPAGIGVLVITVMLLRLLRRRDESAWTAALFAWNPVVIYQMGVMGRSAVWVALLLLPLLVLAVAKRRK